MGDNVSVEQKNNFQERLQYVQNIQDGNFGTVGVYRFKQPPYEYIMDFTKTFIEGDTRVHDYCEFMAQLKLKQHKNIAKIYISQIQKENHMCIKDTKVHTYCNYYNFTLLQAVEKKKIKQTRFSQSQLSFVMFCLLDVATYLQQFKIVFGDFQPSKIFLSPEGYIKLYLLDLHQQNKHTSYYKCLVQKFLIDQYILAPEELSSLQKMEYQPNYNLFKAEVFHIGMVILQLLTHDKTKFYYNEERSAYKMGRINFDLSSLSNEYSPAFLELVRACLMENPFQRIQLDQALSRIEELRSKSSSVSYCLRLHDEGQPPKSNKYPSISAKGQYILNGIEKRLTPSPIISLASSSTSSGFQNKNSMSRTEYAFRDTK